MGIIFKKVREIGGEKGLFTSGCKIDDEHGVLICTPVFETFKTGKKFTGTRPVVAELIGKKVRIKDTGETPEPVLEMLKDSIEKDILVD